MADNSSVLNARIKRVIRNMCKDRLNSKSIQFVSEELYDIYTSNPNFRHEYSSITSVLVHEIQNDTSGTDNVDQINKLPPIEILTANLADLESDYRARYSVSTDAQGAEAAMKKFNKLCDHIKLETVRLNYMSDIKSDVRSNQNFQKKFTDVRNEVHKVESDLDSAKSGYIAQIVSILSIFAAIVITFSGGLTLLGNGFVAIKDSKSPFRILFMCSLFGFIMYNCIVGLMFIVSRMDHKDIGVACKVRYSCYGCQNNKTKSILWNIFCQAVHKYPYIVVVEFLFMYFMYLVFILWSFTLSNKEIFPQILHQGNYLVEVLLIFMPFIVALLIYYRKIIWKFFKKFKK